MPAPTTFVITGKRHPKPKSNLANGLGVAAIVVAFVFAALYGLSEIKIYFFNYKLNWGVFADDPVAYIAVGAPFIFGLLFVSQIVRPDTPMYDWLSAIALILVAGPAIAAFVAWALNLYTLTAFDWVFIWSTLIGSGLFVLAIWWSNYRDEFDPGSPKDDIQIDAQTTELVSLLSADFNITPK